EGRRFYRRDRRQAGQEYVCLYDGARRRKAWRASGTDHRALRAANESHDQAGMTSSACGFAGRPAKPQAAIVHFFVYSPCTSCFAPSSSVPLRSEIVILSFSTTILKLNLAPLSGRFSTFFLSISVMVKSITPSLSRVNSQSITGPSSTPPGLR